MLKMENKDVKREIKEEMEEEIVREWKINIEKIRNNFQMYGQHVIEKPRKRNSKICGS